MRSLAIVLVAAITLAGFSALPSARSECQWDEPTHVYVASAGAGAFWDESGALGATAPVATVDTCTDPNTHFAADGLIGDGDPETGFGGGTFPAYQACLADPAMAHHGAYEGAAYTATQDAAWSALGIAVFAGTDGEDVPGSCLGDGVIDDHSPVDCGSGAIGYGIGAATGVIGANAPLLDPVTGDVLIAPDCTKPADGTVWVVLPAGLVFPGPGGPVILATPIDLCIEQALQPSVPAVPWCMDLGSLPGVNVEGAFAAVPIGGTIEQTA